MDSRRTKVLKLKVFRFLIVLVGICVGQLVLYGPCLTGRKILLPLDILASDSVYLPGKPLLPHERIRSDLVEQWEPARQFAISQFRAGRLPMWNPYQYAGAPVIWPKFSPFLLAQSCSASPVILAWTQLLFAVLAGGGIYRFLRGAMRVNFWAAAVPSWCYPATGFFVFWQGYPTVYPVYWLPWLLLAVDRVIKGPGKAPPKALCLLSGFVLVSGALDIAGQVLLVSGLYALWRSLERYRLHRNGSQLGRSLFILAAGWALGFLLAAPYLLPTLEYAHSGARMQHRAKGSEERPPVGLGALAQTVLPYLNGATHSGALWISSGNQSESSAAAYTGVLATLLVAPLAWCSRRHRSINLFWILLGVFGIGWCLNVPGLVTLLRLPGLNMMSHNRLVFSSSLAVLALAASGLDALGRNKIQRQSGFMVPAACLAGLLAWSVYRAWFLPEPIATQLAAMVAHHKPVEWVKCMQDVCQVQHWFVVAFTCSAALCAAGLLGWALLWLHPVWPKWAIPALGLFMAADLIWFAYDHNAQCDPSLYYPRIPALEILRQSPPGRVIGFNCLPATLAQTHGLSDIRGYDAIDPDHLMDLLRVVADPGFKPFPYAQSQWLFPQGQITRDGFRLPPLLDLLNVRYVIFRGTPPPNVRLFCQSPDYWVLENRNALARAFIPKKVETIADPMARIRKLAAPEFDPRKVAYVEQRVNLPADSKGQVKIVREKPECVTLAARMATPGLIVLADMWDTGWKAYLNNQSVPILRVNHALRGVVVPAGEGVLEFRYEPASFRLGLLLAGVGVVILFGWARHKN